jgi:GntR family transcriptional regulator, vanillate catabolism transcriptional regulator
MTPAAADTEVPVTPESASVVATLRKLIIDGRYPAGERLAEIPVSEALGVSRTPVRLAFRTLEQEGLLQKAGKRGFLVRAFSVADVLCAIEVRGVLEGLAARRLAEGGMPEGVHRTLRCCVDDGEKLLGKGYLTGDDLGPWSRLNDTFHRAIVDAAGSRVIADAIARNNHLPFASADSIIIDKTALGQEYQKLRMAQLHHQLVVDALEQRESARVEMLMREHAHIGVRYGRLFGLEVAIPAAATGG